MTYLLLISRNQNWIVGFCDPIKKLFRLAFDLNKIVADCILFLLCVITPDVPQIGKNLRSQEEHIPGRLHFTQQHFKFAFQLVSPNGFAVLAAFDAIILTLAQVIGIKPISAA
ncbi:MAG: hypothetical protein LZF84_04505 [Nitrosomonas sp.]|nr:MAG: hypothetical protein LZF84_04505 [Nitrosomonas sp.]